ncbi:MAG: DUF4935 domain-containing protein [Anaerolineales bacterium]|nr:DUF4935 domain-containing protein [Anaerolineales bacterium]
MKVVLDTNILWQDLPLRSRKFEMLFDFVTKTRSEIVLPQIVYQELEAVYRREAERRLNDFRKARDILGRIFLSFDVADVEIEIDVQVSQYLAYVCKRLGITEEDIVPYRDDYLSCLVNRAIERKRPCSDKGEEFRDALLWMTVLDIAETRRSENVAFISGNIRAFADKDKSLHPDLVKEVVQRNVSVSYYDSLDTFLRKHATKFEFITKDWILATVDTETTRRRIDNLLEMIGDMRLSRWLGGRDSSFSEFQSAYLVGVEDVMDFYAYEMSDGAIQVAAVLVCEVEAEYTAVEEEEEEYLGWGYGFDPSKGDFDFGHTLQTRICETEKFKLAYPEIVVDAHITLLGKEVKEIEIVDLELA